MLGIFKKKAALIIIHVACIVFISLPIVIVCKQGIERHLHPRVVIDFHPFLIAFFVLLIVNITTLIMMLVSRCKRGATCRLAIFVITMCLLYPVSRVCAITLFFESRTDSMDNYLVMDDKDPTMVEIHDFFPERDKLNNLADDGVEIDYSYLCEMPMLWDDWMYDVSLELDFENSSSDFEVYYTALTEKYLDKVSRDGNLICIILRAEEPTYTIEENLWLTHKIVIDTEEQSIMFLAFLGELSWLGDR